MSVISKPTLLLLISFSLTLISACGGSSEGSRPSSASSTSSSSSSNSSSSSSSGPSSSSSSSSSSSGTPIVDPGGFKIEAEAFSAESAPADGNPISVIDLPGGITKVGFITNDSWLRFNGVTFGKVTEWAGPNGEDIAFTLAKGSTDDASTIEVRIDSPTGPTLAIINVPPTGGWDQFQTFYGSFNQKVSGTKDLYFVFKGPGFVTDLDYFQLASASWAPSKPATPIINAWSDPATWGGKCQQVVM